MCFAESFLRHSTLSCVIHRRVSDCCLFTHEHSIALSSKVFGSSSLDPCVLALMTTSDLSLCSESNHLHVAIWELDHFSPEVCAAHPALSAARCQECFLIHNLHWAPQKTQIFLYMLSQTAVEWMMFLLFNRSVDPLLFSTLLLFCADLEILHGLQSTSLA